LPKEEQRIIGLLYGPDEPSEITYRDIYELLRQELSGCVVPNVLLLGTHGSEEPADGLLKEAVRSIVEGWPPPPFRIAGRDEGRSAEDFGFDPPPSRVAPSRKLSRTPCASAASGPDEARPFIGGK